jgi:hypothetical protein
MVRPLVSEAIDGSKEMARSVVGLTVTLTDLTGVAPKSLEWALGHLGARLDAASARRALRSIDDEGARQTLAYRAAAHGPERRSPEEVVEIASSLPTAARYNRVLDAYVSRWGNDLGRATRDELAYFRRHEMKLRTPPQPDLPVLRGALRLALRDLDLGVTTRVTAVVPQGADRRIVKLSDVEGARLSGELELVWSAKLDRWQIGGGHVTDHKSGKSYEARPEPGPVAPRPE